MIRIGESCLYSMRRTCFNTNAEHHGHPCPHVGVQFYCSWYAGTIPRATAAKVIENRPVAPSTEGVK